MVFYAYRVWRLMVCDALTLVYLVLSYIKNSFGFKDGSAQIRLLGS